MAFLHRVVNAGRTLDRKYAIGMGRMDLYFCYGDVTLLIDLKVWRDKAPNPLSDGLSQIDGYLQGLGQETGWLVIFDRRSGLPPIAGGTITEPARTPSGKSITLIRA